MVESVVNESASTIYSQSEIELINDEGLIKETLKLSELDPIFASSFDQMIKESFAEGKHFFVAKI